MLGKNEIRINMLTLRSELDHTHVVNSGSILLEKLLEVNIFSKCGINNKAVFIYVSAKNEVSTSNTIDYLLENKIRVCVPKIFDDNTMQAVEIKDRIKDLKIGRFRIYEPGINSAIVNENDIGLALVPGVAFDLSGNRIGFGAGYYDKYFSNEKYYDDIYKIGVCYDFQIIEDIPANEKDVKMDYILKINQEMCN